ncbi:lasso peptide biosynthesis PqqD family chaperone [Streptomyces sp. NPDC059455]|uniref:lasso peptide biosynthesis PqqD family chaperone n=1 Tax=Streptomyces sp. NPDC059455 TaxID=3346837 RepID=UPI003673D3E0
MTFSLAPHMTMTETDTGMVLLDERSGRYWQMNDTGALVLRCLLDGGSAESVTSELRRRFPTATDDFAADVEALIGVVRTAGVVIA